MFGYNKELFTDNFNIQIYVISLRHADRLQNIADQEYTINRKIEIFDAVKGDNLNINELQEMGVLDKLMASDETHRKREIGCYLSHFRLYEKIQAENKDGYSIIFEDDFQILSDTFNDDVNTAIHKLSENNIEFDMLFLGNSSNNYGTQLVDNIYYTNKTTNGLTGTHAILINNKNIGKIINCTKYIDTSIDWKLGNLDRQNMLNVFLLNPVICIWNIEKFPSYIRT